MSFHNLQIVKAMVSHEDLNFISAVQDVILNLDRGMTLRLKYFFWQKWQLHCIAWKAIVGMWR